MALPRTPGLATDCVIFDPVGRVLLIRRKHAPCAGSHALPGGFVKVGETVEDACRREVREETSVELNELALVGVYSDLNRDPRGHIVQHVDGLSVEFSRCRWMLAGSVTSIASIRNLSLFPARRRSSQADAGSRQAA